MISLERLTEEVSNASVEKNDKRALSCADAFRLAGEFDAELPDIFRICNQQDIRIVQCQLGCFP